MLDSFKNMNENVFLNGTALRLYHFQRQMRAEYHLAASVTCLLPSLCPADASGGLGGCRLSMVTGNSPVSLLPAKHMVCLLVCSKEKESVCHYFLV